MKTVETLLEKPLWHQYESALEEACEIYRAHGKAVSKFGTSGQSRFALLPQSEQILILKSLKEKNRLLRASLAHEPEFRDRHHSLLWGALKELGLRPPSDAFKYIQGNHLVEIYNVNFQQVFRSLNFLQFVSYSIDELTTYHWNDLYERTGDTTKEMLAMAELVRGNQHPTTYVRPFTRCVVKERFSSRAVCADSDSVIGASLFNDSGKFAGYLSVIEIFHSWSDSLTAH